MNVEVLTFHLGIFSRIEIIDFMKRAVGISTMCSLLQKLFDAPWYQCTLKRFLIMVHPIANGAPLLNPELHLLVYVA